MTEQEKLWRDNLLYYLVKTEEFRKDLLEGKFTKEELNQLFGISVEITDDEVRFF